VSPDNARGWLRTLLPLARDGGPVLSLLLGVLFVASTWYGLGVLKECVQHNRTLNERITAQQQQFMSELRLMLAHCPPAPR
jgi:hypothetical protein